MVDRGRGSLLAKRNEEFPCFIHLIYLAAIFQLRLVFNRRIRFLGRGSEHPLFRRGGFLKKGGSEGVRSLTILCGRHGRMVPMVNFGNILYLLSNKLSLSRKCIAYKHACISDRFSIWFCVRIPQVQIIWLLRKSF